MSSTLIKRFSYSSIESYKKCPAQFKFRYVDNIRKKDESIEAFMGKKVHEALEYLYNEVLEGRIPFFDKIVDKYNSNWNDSWHKKIGIVRVENPPEYYRHLGENCIARYYRKYSPFEQPIVGNEIQIEFSLDGEEGNYPIKGIIDRLDHDGNGNWEIHDYKSGKRAFTQKQADTDNQLALYQLGLMSKGKEFTSVKLVWHFLQLGVEIISERNKVQLDKLSSDYKNKIDNIRKKIDSKSEFTPKTSILCNWCYNWEECPAQSGSNPYIK